MLINIHPINPQNRLIKQAAEIIKKGGIIAYPTDTNYGLGCDIMNKNAISKIYNLKNESPKKHYSFMCYDLKQISEYAHISNQAYRLMKRLLPGSYTFILEGTKMVPKIMLTKRKTVGIRIPNNIILLKLLELLDYPLLTTTAKNLDGEILNDPLEIKEYFKKRLDAVIDGGPVPGESSSVISFLSDPPEVIREGLGDTSFI